MNSSSVSPRGPLVVAHSPSQLRVGATWLVIAQWAQACRELFGDSWISTPAGLLDEEEARSFATMRSRGRSEVSSWRRAVPEPMVTLAKDVRAAARSRIGDVPVPDGADIAFILQHHLVFHHRGFDVATRLGVPVVVGVESLQVREATSWGVRRPGWGGALEKFGERSLLRRADAVLTLSEESGTQIADIVGTEKVVVVGTKADLALFEGHDREDARARLGVGTSFVVGWVGSFRPFHALDVVLDGFERLLATVPDSVLVLVGDGPERAMCEQFAARVGRDRVVMTGMVPFRDVPGLIVAFDAAVVGGRAGEAFHYSPLKLQEYLAAGVPVVAPALGQAIDILGDGTAGTLYEPGDSVGLAQALDDLASNDDRRRQLADAAKVRARELGTAADEMRKVCQMIGVDPGQPS